ncbi:MAG: hypothetical protein ACXVZ3_06230 [Gaiellaceae bacterium]
MRQLRSLAIVPAVVALAACGGSSHRSSPPPSSPPPAAAPGALQPDAASVASGDIPDNQVFLVFRDARAGYSMKYPEGWAQQGAGARVTFRDKDNVVRVVIAKGTATAATIAHDLAALHGAHVRSGPGPATIPGAFKVVYTTESAPNPVTGKRVTLTVDRYYLPRGGRTAVVDLGTPVGVDNVDAYRLMIESFRWR